MHVSMRCVKRAPSLRSELLFRATAHLRVPASVTLESLRHQLEALAGELMVDLEIEDVEEK